MENVIKVSYNVVDGIAVVNEELMPRSIVVLNARGKGLNIAAKCRNTDRTSVLKALTKAVFAEMHETYVANNTRDVKVSGNSVKDHVSFIMNCEMVAVTDKNGRIISDSILSVRDSTINGKLKELFKIDKKKGMYVLCVLNAPDWENEYVQAELRAFVNAAVTKIDYVTRLDEAIAEAADSNYAEAAEEIRKRWEAAHTPAAPAPAKKKTRKTA